MCDGHSTSSTFSSQCSCLSANQATALAEVNMQPASSIISGISNKCSMSNRLSGWGHYASTPLMEHDCCVFPHGSISAWMPPLCHTTLSDRQAGQTNLFGMGGWVVVGNKTDGRLGTTFPIKLGYQTLLVAFNKAHTTAQERKKKRERWSCWRKDRADWDKPQERWRPWVPLKLPDSLLQQYGHAWWWQPQRELSTRVGEWKTALFLNHQRNASKAGTLILPFQKKHTALQRGRWEKNANTFS